MPYNIESKIRKSDIYIILATEKATGQIQESGTKLGSLNLSARELKKGIVYSFKDYTSFNIPTITYI